MMFFGKYVVVMGGGFGVGVDIVYVFWVVGVKVMIMGWNVEKLVV